MDSIFTIERAYFLDFIVLYIIFLNGILYIYRAKRKAHYFF